jgi:hypothetical protein
VVASLLASAAHELLVLPASELFFHETQLKETVFLKMNLFDNLIFGNGGNFKKLYSLQ